MRLKEMRVIAQRLQLNLVSIHAPYFDIWRACEKANDLASTLFTKLLRFGGSVMFWRLLLACVLHYPICGCMDYTRLDESEAINELYNFPPIIDAEHLIPNPTRLTEPLGVGQNCKGQTFMVPPIQDRNHNDYLYYLWFLDDNLLLSQATIKPELRSNGIITLTINEQFLQTFFQTKIPNDFYQKSHVLEFFVSDLPYTLPESRLIENGEKSQEDHGDYAYWIIRFRNDPC